jgi:hypothetical protein
MLDPPGHPEVGGVVGRRRCCAAGTPAR